MTENAQLDLHAGLTPTERVAAVKAAMPSGGMFAGKEWRVSPDPFVLTKPEHKELEKLGYRLWQFVQACDLIFRWSQQGKTPSWVANLLSAGKPQWMTNFASEKGMVNEFPRVLRPDLVLTDDGFAMSELDSVPGGIGLLGWMNRIYAALGEKVIGGENGMLAGFASLFPNGADILVSKESADYRPEMEWLAGELNSMGGGVFSVHDAEGATVASGRDVYRFFELFDLQNIEGSRELAQRAAKGEVRISAPVKPWIEEKLWLALFWSAPLRETWAKAMRRNHWEGLSKVIPYGWVVDPTPLPPHAVLPRLEVQSWDEVKQFTQSERELVLKISGFDDTAWGSRGVKIGHDISSGEWSTALDHALAAFENHPHVLQRFHKGRVVKHQFWNEQRGEMDTMDARVRLTPYYFISRTSDEVTLGGVHATICPADKKILHGMSDAVMVPCVVGG